MAIQPRVRVFYELATSRAVETKSLKLQEYVTTSMVPKGASSPFQAGTPPRSQVLSQAKRDPTQYNYITVTSESLGEFTFRTLRVIAPEFLVKDTKNIALLPDIANPSSKPKTGTVKPVAGAKSKVVEKGAIKDVTILSFSVDSDINPPLILVTVEDPGATDEEEKKKTKYILVFERTEIVVVPEVNWPKYMIEERAPGDFDIIGQFSKRYKLVIADVLPIGPALRVIQINNTAGAKIVDSNQNPGITKVLEVSENHNSSNQEGRYGKLGVSRIGNPTTGEKRFFLQWKAPEAEEYGLPVEIGLTGTSKCPFTVKSLVDVVDPNTGSTFTKELRMRVEVQSSLLRDAEFVETWVNVTTVFDKTYDGRPLFGNQSVQTPPGIPFEQVMPAIQIVQPKTDLLEPEQQGTNGPFRNLNVDDQGLFLFHNPDDPIPSNRENPRAVFQRRFTDTGVIRGVDAAGNIQVEDIKVLKKIVLPEKDGPIWLVPSPNEKFITYVQEKGALRPNSKEPDSPDGVTYPYKWTTPVNMATKPETLPSDETLLLFPQRASQIVTGADPNYNPDDFPYTGRLQHFAIPYIRLTQDIYFFFIIEEDMINELKVNPTEIARECVEQGENPTDIDESFKDRPLSSHITTSGSVQFSPGQAFIPDSAETVIIMAYPQEQKAGQNALADRMQELADNCEALPRSELEEMDILQEIVNITGSGG